MGSNVTAMVVVAGDNVELKGILQGGASENILQRAISADKEVMVIQCSGCR